MEKKELLEYKKHRKGYFKRNLLIIIFMIFGVVFLCSSLATMQNVSSEKKQKNNSEKILHEVTEILNDNDETVKSITLEYNELNQTTISTLASYIKQKNVLDPLNAAESMTPEEQQVLLSKACDGFEGVKNDINSGTIYLLDDKGQVIICSDKSYLGKNIKEAIGESGLYILTRYNSDGSVNGTVSSDGANMIYSPLVTPGNDSSGGYYTFSTYLDSKDNTKYFLVMSQSASILESELEGIKKIDNVLSGITVGQNGFLFAIDTDNGNFIYYENDGHNLSGESYTDYGYKTKAAKDNYSGYQSIDGTKYYCVTKEFKSETYGNYTIVAAAVSKSDLIGNNISIIAFSCLAFIVVAFVLAGYGIILRNDIANYTIGLEKKFYNELRDDVDSGKVNYTEDEIKERAEVKLLSIIDQNDDKKLKRRMFGTRSKKGNQHYFSGYIAIKVFPMIIVGLFAIFGISFFSQTLISLEDVTSISSSRLNDIDDVINKNQESSEKIQAYVDSQFLSKTKLIAYLIQESPNDVFSYDVESPTTHPILNASRVDYEGHPQKYELDMYGNIKYSIASSELLDRFCLANKLSSIYIFDEDGSTIATNAKEWSFKLSENKEDQSYPFNSIITGENDYYIQEAMAAELSGKQMQYIGNVFYYYTYQASDDSTQYASINDYNSYLAGTWSGSKITKHRGMVQIGIDQSNINKLFEITTIEYILKGMHVYGNDSFFIAFDKSDEHKIIYSPTESVIGKSAKDVGASSKMFLLSGEYNGFQTVNGEEYYWTCSLVGDYYIATAVPTESLYSERNLIAAYTTLFSAIVIVLAAFAYILSSDKADADTIAYVKNSRNGGASQGSFMINTPSGRKRTIAASQRYARSKWHNKSADQKLASILMVYLTIASILIFISIVYALNNKNSNSIIAYIFNGSWERKFNVFSVTEALMIMIMVITITKIAQICVRTFCGTLGARVETTGDLIVSILRYGGIIGGFFYCLYLFGFNTTSLLTSAGILSIVIGLGAQSLISDILAGIFIVFEGEFRVGDIVTIGDFRGQVLEIGLRTTKIEDSIKNIKIFNNSSISGVVNMTKEASYAYVDVGIEYGESLERVENVLKNAFPEIRKNLPAITDGPFYKGVVELGDSSVVIKIVAQCDENDRLQLVRDLNREIFLLFNKNGINIPFPQVTLSYLSESDVKPTKKQIESAEEFVKEQKEESKYLNVEDNK